MVIDCVEACAALDTTGLQTQKHGADQLIADLLPDAVHAL